MKSVIRCAMIAAAALAAAAGSAVAQTTVTLNPGDTMVSQNFNSLAATGSGVAWSNVAVATLEGWAAYRSGAGSTAGRNATLTSVPTYNASAGGSNAGNLYSFGTGTDADRALGTIGSGTPGDFLILLAVLNNTGATIDEFTLSYDLEQWRNGGGAVGAQIGVQHFLELDYKVVNGLMVGTDTDASFISGYTAPGGNWDGLGPVGLTATAGAAMDGNTVGLAAGRGGTTPTGLNWGQGQTLIIRWWDDNSVGNDHALALDNVLLTVPAIPGPGSAALLGVAGLIASRRRRA